MVSFTVRLAESQISGLRAIAEREHVSVSAVVRSAVDGLLSSDDAETRRRAHSPTRDTLLMRGLGMSE